MIFFFLWLHLVWQSLGPSQFSQFSSVQFSHSVVSDSLRPHELHVHQASLSITISQSSLKLTSMESVMPSSRLILCCPFLLLPAIPSSIRVFSNESTLCMRWPKYWSFSFSIVPSKEHPGLIPFRMDWLDLLAVQGTLKSLHQHHSSKESILWRSAFFTVQLSHTYMTTGKTVYVAANGIISFFFFYGWITVQIFFCYPKQFTNSVRSVSNSYAFSLSSLFLL